MKLTRYESTINFLEKERKVCFDALEALHNISINNNIYSHDETWIKKQAKEIGDRIENIEICLRELK
jgi:hypothetical protein